MFYIGIAIGAVARKFCYLVFSVYLKTGLMSLRQHKAADDSPAAHIDIVQAWLKSQ